MGEEREYYRCDCERNCLVQVLIIAPQPKINNHNHNSLPGTDIVQFQEEKKDE